MMKRKTYLLCLLLIPALFLVLIAGIESSWADDDDDDQQSSSENDDGTIDLNPLLVQDSKPKDGSSETGYLVESSQQLGPWGELPLQDTPYSFTVVPRELIENTGAQTYEQILSRIPQVQTMSHQGTAAYQNSSAMIRGLNSALLIEGMSTNKSGSSIGGASEVYGDPIGTLEEFERAEVISGYTGFLNGAAMSGSTGGAPGGAINFILKRPTKERYNRITIGNYGGEQYFTHFDFGGPIKDGKFGYRVNTWGSDGETVFKNMNQRTKGIAVALDWNITDDLLFQVDYSYKTYHRSGLKDGIAGMGSANRNDFYNPKNLGFPNDLAWGQKWSYLETEAEKFGANLTWNLFDDKITVRASYRRLMNELDMDIGWSNFNYLTKIPEYVSEARFRYRWDIQGGNIFVDAKFDTSFIKHKLTVGFQGTFEDVLNPYPASMFNRFVIMPTWSNPYVPQPSRSMPPYYPAGVTNFSNRWITTQKLSVKDIIIGDQINFGDKVIVLIGANHTNITQRTYDGQTGKISISGSTGKPEIYNKSAWTPNYSLIYKPTDKISLYGTYIEALQRGSFVGVVGSITDINGIYHDNIPIRNAGATMAPSVSKQYELGVNTLINDSLRINLAAFKIQKANEISTYHDPDNDYPQGSITVSQEGEEIYKGVELTVAGKVTERLTAFGGVTYVKATIEKLANTPTGKQQEGRPKTGVPDWTAKMYLEYQLPFLDGFFVTGGAYYSGKKHQGNTAMNDWKMPSYYLFDGGLRYETKIKGVDTTFNLYAYNLTNKYYWDGGLGDPRTVTFSVSFKF